MGELKELHAFVGKDRFYEGDRIMFRRNDRDLKVKNGQMGNILRVDNLRKQLTVGFDNDQRVSFSHEEYDQFGLGYASTVHRAQGVTVGSSYVFAVGGQWDRHTAYVAASRRVSSLVRLSPKYTTTEAYHSSTTGGSFSPSSSAGGKVV